MKLSICMMVKNEEKNLPRCLEKLKPLTESGLAELIIIDTGSEDQSENIAKQYTNKVYFHKWNKNFSKMRNISISYAKGEWIFIIDADERLDDVEKLIILMNSSEIKKCNTILLQVKNLYYVTDESKYNLIVSPRLFKNDGKFRYEGAVHNQPMFKGPNLSVDINLMHFGYIANDKKLMELKYNRTTELLKSELAKEPENLYYMYQLGVSYDMHGEYKEALNEFRRAYSILKNRSLEEKKIYVYVYASYSRIAYTNNEFKESVKVAKEALNLKRDYIDLYYILGISEIQLRNDKDAFEYFNSYVDLVKRYNQLEISKDMSIIMYHIDDKSKSTAYFEIVKYYLNLEKFKDAYDIYNNITSIDEKIYASINILIPIEKYSELREVYNSITIEKDKNNFLCTLEEKIKKVEDGQKINLYKEFSVNEDVYGLLNNIRISSNVDEKVSLTKLLIKEIDFNEVPLFYGEIFVYIKDDIKLITKIFREIEVCNLRNIIKQLIEEREFVEIFENYILQNKIDILEIKEHKVHICIANELMAIHIKNGNEIGEKYLDIFKTYVKYGIKFISQLYQIKDAETIYKSVNNEEDRFFIIMYIINKFIKLNDMKSAVNYMIEAVNLNKTISKYIDIYKNEIFNLKEKNQNESEKEKQQFENYKLKVKENINSLINEEKLEEAKKLINEYEEIIKQDVEIYSIKAVICIMEGKINEGEKILEDGLKVDNYNADLLLNLSYVQSQKNDNTNAIENYSKAKLFNPSNNIKISDIITNLQPVDNNNLRVLNGTIEIANQMSTITKGLRNLGLDAKSLNYYPNYLGYKSDYVLDVNSFKDSDEAKAETKKIAAKMIAENDVFHFHYGTSLVFDYSDLFLLKELGKKVFMQYWGSDIRMYSKAIKMNPFVKVKKMNEDTIKQELHCLSKYISHCIVSDYELYEYVKNIYDNVYLVRQSIDLENYKVSKPKNNKLHIVHAPSSPEAKGTKYILNAIENLKDKYDFDFTLVQGMAHEEAKMIYAKADLIIDQILCGSYGVFAIEAMAMGKPVISWISDFMVDKYPNELPIISANPKTIEDKLEYLFNNRELLDELGDRGRKYVEKYHDMNVISKQLLELYKSI